MIRSSGPTNAKIMIVAEWPGEQDVLKGSILSSWAGEELNKMLAEAGIFRSQCYVTSVLKQRPFASKMDSVVAMRKKDVTDKHILIGDKMCLPEVAHGISQLCREIELVQPNIIIALGELSLWALTGKSSVSKWRGSMLQAEVELSLDYKPKLLPTYAPGMIMKNWEWRPISVQDFRRARTMAETKELIRPEYSFLLRPNFAKTKMVLETLLKIVESKPTKLSLDIETAKGYIETFGIAWSALEAISIPFLIPGTWTSYWETSEEEAEIVYLIYKLTTHKNALCIGQNFHYDAQYTLKAWHFCPNIVRDTMITQHSMYSNIQKSLDFQSSMYCAFHEYWKDDGKDCGNEEDAERRWEYNCKDAVVTFEIDDVHQKVLESMGDRAKSVQVFQQDLWKPVLKTMQRGVRYDHAKKAIFAQKVLEQILERQSWVNEAVGQDFNIGSSPQMAELFYSTLGQKVIKDRKTKQPTLNDEALATIAEREPILLPLTKKIRQMRSLNVFLKTFLMAQTDDDGRMRTFFSIPGTVTYRFASKTNAFGGGLNFQNLPKGSDDAEVWLPNVRELFIPDPGFEFFDIDLSSADLRIVVWEADEPEYKAMLREGADPYTEIAKEFYHDPTINKKDPRRQVFKSFAHGTHYLGTAAGLAGRLGLLVHQAEQTQKWYFGRFPRIKRWQEDLIAQVDKRRFVENIFGHRMYILKRIEGTVYNEAVAWIPQSTVGCVINAGYKRIDATFPQAQVLLQVHDSLAGQYPAHLGEWARKKIIDCVEQPLPYDDPLIIPVGIKTSTVSWGHCD